MILSTASIADRLIKEHGELAPGVAAKHACKLQKAGDEIRSRQWTKVMIESKMLLARDYAE